MVRNNPGAFVIVTGCYAQLESENVSKIEGVDLVLGANEKANLIQYLSDAWAQKFAQETDWLLRLLRTAMLKLLRTAMLKPLRTAMQRLFISIIA